VGHPPSLPHPPPSSPSPTNHPLPHHPPTTSLCTCAHATADRERRLRVDQPREQSRQGCGRQGAVSNQPTPFRKPLFVPWSVKSLLGTSAVCAHSTSQWCHRCVLSYRCRPRVWLRNDSTWYRSGVILEGRPVALHCTALRHSLVLLICASATFQWCGALGAPFLQYRVRSVSVRLQQAAFAPLSMI
jgi:hypothetical protein